MKIQIAKGVRDISPEEKILKNKIVETIKKYFELYGYNPLDTPIIERFDVLGSKYAGGEEITKEIFRLNDQGERDLCLRYDLTVPLARYIAMNPMVKMPFKRYQIGQVFRDGPIKLGRYREFTQCDVDVIGNKDIIADAELLRIVQDVFKELKLKIEVKFNSRKILDAILDTAKIPEDKKMTAILSLDKIEKIGAEGVEKELLGKGLTNEMIKKLFELTEKKKNNRETLEFLKKNISEEAVNEIEQMLSYLKSLETKAEFYPNLARGLTYYTGPVFEVFAVDSEVKSSIAGGGRYDKMIEKFIGRNQEYPATGISFGIDVIFQVMKEKEKELRKTNVKVLVIPIRADEEGIKLTQRLREKNISVELNGFKKGVFKGLEYASSYGIPFSVFLGESEIKDKKVKLRDMTSGKEELITEEELIKRLSE